jgi:hypothetical protein
MKSKKSDLIKKEEVKSHEGFNIGDAVWFKPFSGDTRPILGTIRGFYLEDSLGPAVSLEEEVRGRYTVTLVENLLKSPPKGALKRHTREMINRNKTESTNKRKKK